jgi:hypothetical protein
VRGPVNELFKSYVAAQRSNICRDSSEVLAIRCYSYWDIRRERGGTIVTGIDCVAPI